MLSMRSMLVARIERESDRTLLYRGDGFYVIASPHTAIEVGEVIEYEHYGNFGFIINDRLKSNAPEPKIPEKGVFLIINNKPNL